MNRFSKLAKGYVGILLNVLFLLLGTAAWSSPKPKALQLYFVDVEGGQATLFVTPAGESLLIDTGWPGFDGRDADRIVAAAKAAGITFIHLPFNTASPNPARCWPTTEPWLHPRRMG